ncbi:BZ3500_MvSof-1268-A1-R1_Chr2-1g04401 [Microbotryum saponariae]|uniref:BZ3500_MvSof-1268-A1-R1_Chr2-1g04401 protein n=1 Tax=Microbotryum saponariae TaxID=289078 RepID=A0A2X0MIW8_9BASI|nr:BZ3500_MvSof-1268-A1-R1_Chr2-1g04401 [Microbotryum saponariae]SCZ91615.1 BZ3501_MvSof-1269-A2-R1_Chr2-1g04057 [Microbotryum saponariae]
MFLTARHIYLVVFESDQACLEAAAKAQGAVRNDATPASNVIRGIMDGLGSPRSLVQTALRKHFGLAERPETPFMLALSGPR